LQVAGAPWPLGRLTMLLSSAAVILSLLGFLGILLAKDLKRLTWRRIALTTWISLSGAYVLGSMVAAAVIKRITNILSDTFLIGSGLAFLWAPLGLVLMIACRKEVLHSHAQRPRSWRFVAAVLASSSMLSIAALVFLMEALAELALRIAFDSFP